jgi:alkyl hydroperoxide reductase subunit F
VLNTGPKNDLIEVQLESARAEKQVGGDFTGARWRNITAPGEAEFKNAAYCPHYDVATVQRQTPQ